MLNINTIECDGVTWTLFGAGSFNLVYKHPSEDLVLKLVKNWDPDDPIDLASLDEANRAAKVFNEVNPGSNARVTKCTFNSVERDAWICPYYKSHPQQPTDDEINDELDSIYERSGRVILDACVDGNFIKTENGQVICIDIGLALKAEFNYETHLSDAVSTERQRSGSVDHSDYKLAILDYTEQNGNFNKLSAAKKVTVDRLKALLYLQKKRPDRTDVKTLLKNPALVQKLVTAFDGNSNDLFEQQIPINLEKLKNSLVMYCTSYINSRGALNKENIFEAGMLMKTILCRDKSMSKVKQMESLIEQIKSADTLEALEKLINDSKKETKFVEKGFVFSGVDSCLNKCSAAIHTFNTIGLRNAGNIQKP